MIEYSAVTAMIGHENDDRGIVFFFLIGRVEPDTRLKQVSGTDKALLPSTSIIRVIRVNICARIE